MAAGSAASPWIIAAGAAAYFGALLLLGFRLADFNRREAMPTDCRRRPTSRIA